MFTVPGAFYGDGNDDDGAYKDEAHDEDTAEESTEMVLVAIFEKQQASTSLSTILALTLDSTPTRHPP